MRATRCSRRSRYEAWFLRLWVAVLIAGAVLALASPAVFAAGGGEGGHQEAQHAAHFGKSMVFQLINFALLVILLVYVYRKNAGGAFEKRSEEVRTAMEEAAKAKKAAEDKYLEYQTRVSELDAEIEKLFELAGRDADKERASMIEEAERQAAKIVEQAELTARHEVVLAKQALRQEAAELTAQMAADAIRKAATPEDQRKWVQTYIDKIGEVQ